MEEIEDDWRSKKLWYTDMQRLRWLDRLEQVVGGIRTGFCKGLWTKGGEA